MISALMADPVAVAKMDKIVALCKRRGFIFQSSEIYGGLNGFWDYSPLGAELKRNIKESWWRTMTQMRDDVVGLEASIIMHPKIWEASGHTSTFSDLMVDCLLTKKRFRADHPADVCFARGTFNSHPYVMGAMHAYLKKIDSPEITKLYGDLDSIWNGRREKLNRRLKEADIRCA